MYILTDQCTVNETFAIRYRKLSTLIQFEAIVHLKKLTTAINKQIQFEHY